MNMKIHTFMNIIKEIESKQRFASFAKYYYDYFITFDILYIFIFLYSYSYGYSMDFCTFKFRDN